MRRISQLMCLSLLPVSFALAAGDTPPSLVEQEGVTADVTTDTTQMLLVPSEASTADEAPPSLSDNVDAQTFPVQDPSSEPIDYFDEAELRKSAPLVYAWRKAQQYDPAFLAAQADRDLNLLKSKAAFAAIFPELRFSRTQFETERSTRTTMQLSQPLFNIERYVTFKESYPREALTYAQFTIKQYDLLSRLTKAVADVIRTNELAELNQIKINTLEQQARGAQRLYQLGVGTLTDERETAVRLSQAMAERLSLRSKQQNAEKTLQSIVGPFVGKDDFKLSENPPKFRLEALSDYVTEALVSNPGLVVAQQNAKIADLGVLKAAGAFLPQVSATITRSERESTTTNNSGISIQYPLGATNYYARSIAKATLEAAEQQTRQQEEVTKLNTEKFYGAVVSGLEEVQARKDAIKAAELSLEGNEKSFKGGIRSRTDVLNSIQSLFQIREQYMESVLTLAENYLNLRLSAVTDQEALLAELQRVLF